MEDQGVYNASVIQQRRKAFDAWPPEPPGLPSHLRVNHQELRVYEQGFAEVLYYSGAPWIPWSEWAVLLNGQPNRSKQQVVRDHFNGEYLLKQFDGTFQVHQVGQGLYSGEIYLRLSHALNDQRMLQLVLKVWVREVERRRRWKLAQHVKGYVVYRGPHCPRLLYSRPDECLPGLYCMHCGTTTDFNDGVYAGPFFVLRCGGSKDLSGRYARHTVSTSTTRAHGQVQWLFGLEVARVYLAEAETTMHAKLTALGFNIVVTTATRARSQSLYFFNAKSCPLVHDILEQIGIIYPRSGGRSRTEEGDDSFSYSDQESLPESQQSTTSGYLPMASLLNSE